MRQIFVVAASIFFCGMAFAGDGNVDTEYDPLLDAANLEADTFFLNRNVEA